MKRATIIIGVLVGITFAVACGGGDSSLPDPIVCPPVAPGATPSPGQFATQRYFQSITNGEAKLESIGRGFIDRWPGRKFARTSTFRVDLATTSDAAACLAQQLMAIAPPGERFEQYDRALDDVLVQFAEDVAVGREAARQRNVSKFRDWLKAVDELAGKLDAVEATRPPARP